MHKNIVITIIALALTGCATTVWKHPVNNPAVAYSDEVFCKRDILNHGPDKKYSGHDLLLKKEIDRCMTGKKGWTRVTEYSLCNEFLFPFCHTPSHSRKSTVPFM